MDILAARKRAAERAKSGNPAEKQQVTAPSEPPAEKTAFGFVAAESEQEPLSSERAAAVLPESGEATAGSRAASPSAERALPSAEPAVSEPESADAAAATPASQLEGSAPSQEPASEADREMLAVVLGREEYAIPVERVREVLSPREVTPVPHTPEYILGVCALRGAVLPIIDLKQRLGLAKTEIDEKTRVVVVGLDDEDRIGFLVDRVRGVLRFPAAQVRPVPETVEQGAEFLAGIVRQEERLIILLDVYKAATA